MFGIKKLKQDFLQLRERLEKAQERNNTLTEKLKNLQNHVDNRHREVSDKAQDLGQKLKKSGDQFSQQFSKSDQRFTKTEERIAKTDEKLQQLTTFVQTLPDPAVAREIEKIRSLCGSLAAHRSRSLPPDADFADAEFKVSSQWGEDGILQFLLAHVPIENETFVEFGVQDYSEANTRFLLAHDNWKGLIIDGSKEWMSAVRKSELAWRYTLHATDAWITAENINSLIQDAGISGDIGLLSVDVDGNDYWIWKAITVINPRIVVCEYNSLFGPEAVLTVPYAPDFERGKAHPSCVFYGVSLAAIEALGKEKGYRLVGANSHGNNAFLVRADLDCAIPTRTAREVYRECRFRESRGEKGLSYASFAQARELISECEVFDLGQNGVRKLGAAQTK